MSAAHGCNKEARGRKALTIHAHDAVLAATLTDSVPRRALAVNLTHPFRHRVVRRRGAAVRGRIPGEPRSLPRLRRTASRPAGCLGARLMQAPSRHERRHSAPQSAGVLGGRLADCGPHLDTTSSAHTAAPRVGTGTHLVAPRDPTRHIGARSGDGLRTHSGSRSRWCTHPRRVVAQHVVVGRPQWRQANARWRPEGVSRDWLPDNTQIITKGVHGLGGTVTTFTIGLRAVPVRPETGRWVSIGRRCVCGAGGRAHRTQSGWRAGRTTSVVDPSCRPPRTSVGGQRLARERFGSSTGSNSGTATATCDDAAPPGATPARPGSATEPHLR